MHLVNGKGSIIRLIAGSFILISVLLSVLHTEYWLIFTATVGVMLILSSITGFCPMEYFLKWLGIGTVKTLVDLKDESKSTK